MASLRVKGNKYHVMFYFNGKQIERSTGIDVRGNNKRKAQKVAEKIVSEYQHLNASKNKELFTVFMLDWLNEVNGLVKPSTFETYDKTIHGKLLPYFEKGNYKLKDLTPKIFTDYFKYLSINGNVKTHAGLKYKSVKNIKSVLSTMLDFAVENKYIEENPISKSKMPVFANDIEKEINIYNNNEIKQLLNYAEKTNSSVYMFLLIECFTGLRKGEIMALTWNDVDFKKGVIYINKSRTGSRSEIAQTVTTPKTKSSNRIVPLNDKVLNVLSSEKIKQEKQDKMCNYHYKEIIRNQYGVPYKNLSAVNRVVNRLMDNAGVKRCTIHGLRHSVASMLDDNGVSIQDIAVLLGHDNISTTEKHYIHRSRKAKKDTADILDRLINSD